MSPRGAQRRIDKNGTLTGATPAGRPARGPVGQRASGQERS